MALVLLDRVQQTGTANTTVSFTLSGSVTGFQSFSAVGNGNTTYYSSTDASGNWEVGIGTYATGGTLTRTTILSSSNAGSAVTFSGAVNVFVTYPSEKSVNLDASGNASALGTPAAFVATNVTGLPLTTGVTGTLPIANGGTNSTATATAGGAAYGTGTAYAVTAAGTSGQILKSNAASAPTWVDLSTVGVNTFSAGTTGFTPSTATSGAITLAGTLGVANGGTGLTTLTANYIPYGNGTSALSSYSGLNFSSPTFAPANMLYSTGGMSVGTGAIAYPTQATGIGYESKGGTSNGRFMVQDGNGRLNQYWNAYTDSGGYKYTVSGEAAARYLMSINSTTGGVHAWYGAPSGTAGTALTWTQMGQMTSGTGGFIWLSARGTSSDFYQDINGNTGFGTTTPIDKVNIVGAGEVGGISDAGGKDASIRVASTNAAGNAGGQIEFGAAYGSGLTQWYFAGIKGLLNNGATNTTGDLAFYTRNAVTDTSLTERMRIDNTGNVGIGTSTLTYGAAVTIQRTGQASLMVWNSGVGSGHIGIGASNSNLKLYNTYSTGTLAGGAGIDVDSSGNVGIGTVSPGTKLAIVSGTNAGISVNDGTVNTILYNTSSTNGTVGTTTNHPMAFYSNNAERMRIDSSGNVGIGTSSPTAGYGPLQFAGGASGSLISTTDAGLNIAQYNGEAYLISYATLSTGGSWTARSTSSSSISSRVGTIVFTTNTGLTSGSSFSPTERMRIAASGGVSIGNTTDQGAGALSVASGVYAESTGPFMLNATTVSANFTIPTNYNAQSAGPITINTGITVTVSTGSNWVIN